MLADYGELCTKSYNDQVYWFRVTGAIDCTIAVVIEQTGGFVLLVLKNSNNKQCEHTKYHIKDTLSNTRSSIISKYKMMLLSTSYTVTNRDVQLLTYLFFENRKMQQHTSNGDTSSQV